MGSKKPGRNPRSKAAPAPHKTAPLDPAEFRTRLIEWYRRSARSLPWRGTTDPYRIWVSEIMLQQTRVAAVIEHYNEFPKALPHAGLRSRLRTRPMFWPACESGLGSSRRARMLHKAAQFIVLERRRASSRDRCRPAHAARHRRLYRGGDRQHRLRRAGRRGRWQRRTRGSAARGARGLVDLHAAHALVRERAAGAGARYVMRRRPRRRLRTARGRKLSPEPARADAEDARGTPKSARRWRPALTQPSGPAGNTRPPSLSTARPGKPGQSGHDGAGRHRRACPASRCAAQCRAVADVPDAADEHRHYNRALASAAFPPPICWARCVSWAPRPMALLELPGSAGDAQVMPAIVGSRAPCRWTPWKGR